MVPVTRCCCFLLLGEGDGLLDGVTARSDPWDWPLCFTDQTERCYGQNSI
jgi:hypothetical protein